MSTDMSRETDTETIRKTVSEFTESTEQMNKSEVKTQMNSQNKIAKNNNLKDRLNAFSLLVL